MCGAVGIVSIVCTSVPGVCWCEVVFVGGCGCFGFVEVLLFCA